ncbi:MAG TPA: alpha/beta hydrolase [Steroidobacteraceae bacterium]|nr:alpha/beta hydrolase [Steroidobacteraceae bacterium]
MTGETLVHVHGLWSSHLDSILLRARLAGAFGFDVRAFRYPAVSRSMAEVVERLARFIGALQPTSLHLVGHSLGGLVIYRFLERFPEQPPGRVVFLGTPSVSCRAALGMARWPGGVALLGQCVAEELLLERERRWRHPRPLGIIAGTRPLGMGHLVARYRGENDGTIGVSETRLPGATEHLTVRASHMGMLLSARVARLTGTFLREGHFAPFTSPCSSSARSS